jgi:hypothetical protein
LPAADAQTGTPFQWKVVPRQVAAEVKQRHETLKPARRSGRYQGAAGLDFTSPNLWSPDFAGFVFEIVTLFGDPVPLTSLEEIRFLIYPRSAATNGMRYKGLVHTGTATNFIPWNGHRSSLNSIKLIGSSTPSRADYHGVVIQKPTAPVETTVQTENFANPMFDFSIIEGIATGDRPRLTISLNADNRLHIQWRPSYPDWAPSHTQQIPSDWQPIPGALPGALSLSVPMSAFLSIFLLKFIKIRSSHLSTRLYAD